MPDRATLDYYEKAAPRTTFDSGAAPSRDLDAFLDRLAPGAHVLELGCGGGRDAARMVERGFVIDPTDGAGALVRKANERFGVGARAMRFDELEAIAQYGAVWAHASLLHVPRAELPDVLVRVRHALTPQGWHYGSYKLGDAEGRCKLGRLHNFPNEELIVTAYREAGFAIEATRRWTGDGADGTMRDWIAIIARKLV